MRSRTKFKVTAQEVHRHAVDWLDKPLGFTDHGPKCTKSVLLSIVLTAAARMCSLFAACRDLAKAPSDQAVRDALFATLPAIVELERRLNNSLCAWVPKALKRKPRELAIDLTLIPYHGEPEDDESELYHSAPKAGTTKFHAYATAYVMQHGYRYTLALTRVTKGEKLRDVLQRLLRKVRDRGLQVKLLLLDRGFFSAEIVGYLKRARVPFVMPVAMRGRRPKGNRPRGGLWGFLKKSSGWYDHVLTGKDGRHERVKICVSAKTYRHKKSGKKRLKRLVYASWNYHAHSTETRETYRRRFGIESSYRQMNQARIRTCTRSPVMRLLFFGVALVLRNVWVWLHYTLFAESKGEHPRLRLGLLRFRRMLHGLQSVVIQMLHNGETYYVEWEV